MPFDSKELQFAHSSLNLRKHGDFNAALLTAQDAQDISWQEPWRSETGAPTNYEGVYHLRCDALVATGADSPRQLRFEPTSVRRIYQNEISFNITPERPAVPKPKGLKNPIN
jgi:hypothetical protein